MYCIVVDVWHRNDIELNGNRPNAVTLVHVLTRVQVKSLRLSDQFLANFGPHLTRYPAD